MYRRSDPRWNRTIQHITENIEHANESAQENLYGFTQRYVNPCLQSVTQCVNACTAPCMPAHSDRRRHRGRSRGRAESSFDFYDDWEVDESDGLLGWGSDNLDRFLGGASNYGATSQPGRLPAMNYAQRNRDPRYDTSRRKSTTAPRDSGQDPTIIPSSSYFGFLGRLPFKIGGKGLRYKPSAADLTEHPGAGHRSTEEEQPLIEDSDEDRQHQGEHKTHRRQRSNTHTSGHTTDSLSSRGDIFPSEDELEDAVPLDDEFTISLERRTTGQWLEDSASNGKTRSGRSKRPSGSRISSQTISSESPQGPDMRCNESVAPSISKSLSADENPALEDLQMEEDILRVREEAKVQRRRREAHQIVVARGLAPEQRYAASIERPLSPASISHMTMGRRATLPQMQSKHREMDGSADIVPLPSSVSSRSIADVNELQTDRSLALAQNALEPQGPGNSALCRSNEADFIPARLPNFGSTHP